MRFKTVQFLFLSFAFFSTSSNAQFDLGKMKEMGKKIKGETKQQESAPFQTTNNQGSESTDPLEAELNNFISQKKKDQCDVSNMHSLRGDVTGDNKPDLISRMYVEGCGGGNMHGTQVVVVANVGQGAKVIGGWFEEGDLKLDRVNNGKIELSGLVVGPNDARCCPNTKVNRVLSHTNGKLVEEKQQSGSPKVASVASSSSSGGLLPSLTYLKKPLNISGSYCKYWKEEDDKKREPPSVAEMDQGDNRVAIGIDGSDQLVKMKSDKGTWKANYRNFDLILREVQVLKRKCEECSYSKYNLQFIEKGELKTEFKLIGVCGS